MSVDVVYAEEEIGGMVLVEFVSDQVLHNLVSSYIDQP